MNRFFGFLKEKFGQVKQQNKQDLQILASAVSQMPSSIISDSNYEYDSQKMQQRLLQMKNNYARWNIYIANEASTGLYYTQIHNRGVILKKIESNKNTNQSVERLKIVSDQMKRTIQQIKQLNTLSSHWVKTISDRTQNLLKLQGKLSVVTNNQSEKQQQDFSDNILSQNTDKIQQSGIQFIEIQDEKIEMKPKEIQQIVVDNNQQQIDIQENQKHQETTNFGLSSPH